MKSNNQKIVEIGLDNKKEDLFEISKTKIHLEISFLFPTALKKIIVTNPIKTHNLSSSLKLAEFQINNWKSFLRLFNKNYVSVTKNSISIPQQKLNPLKFSRIASGYVMQIKILKVSKEKEGDLYSIDFL